ncbi:MAG TPA: S-methyl-5'-thioadenosine phosphorylase [Anaerolineaceae bacterium]|nr:S-methyl-5'-thioadenosine phosphorylase [Anaerolineaceae bacterium]
MPENPVIAVIGGSGLYNFPALRNVKMLDLDTPFGKPSAPIALGELSGRPVAFLARHGIGHHISPTEVNYRANIYALKSIGAHRIVSVSACGSLREDYAPGHIVIPDQIFDFTRSRQRSFFGEGIVSHIGVADPFCPNLSMQVLNAVIAANGTVHKGGTFITIEGPRFSTRAESNIFRQWDISIIGMTACPEAFLAREAEMCYAAMAHVTDYDVWHINEQPVSVEMVVRTLMRNTELAQNAIQILVETLDDTIQCDCEHALENAIITQRDRIPPETIQKLDLLVNKYLK